MVLQRAAVQCKHEQQVGGAGSCGSCSSLLPGSAEGAAVAPGAGWELRGAVTGGAALCQQTGARTVNGAASEAEPSADPVAADL